MLASDNLMHKYYNKKLAPGIKSEKFNRPDILREQDDFKVEAQDTLAE